MKTVEHLDPFDPDFNPFSAHELRRMHDNAARAVALLWIAVFEVGIGVLVLLVILFGGCK